MFSNLVVPVDLSKASLDAVVTAAKMAAQVDGHVDAITIVDEPSEVARVSDELTRSIERLGPQPVEIRPLVQASHTVVGAITAHIDENPGSMLLMSSHGRGRSAAMLGNTVDDVLRAMFGPVIVLGPHATECSGGLGGTYIVPLDGSTRAEGVASIVGAWAIEFHGTPWLVEVLDGDAGKVEPAIVQSSYVHTRAHALQQRIGRDIEFEVLHGRDVGRSIVDFATSQDATLIFMATHGRTGADRLIAGSAAANVVRHATIPVVLFRPPDLK
ncbi:MAG TPA: universal stress protein [Ilumatobacter sp.]|nr:universal stress protein [Ilumatobacter sp.]